MAESEKNRSMDRSKSTETLGRNSSSPSQNREQTGTLGKGRKRYAASAISTGSPSRCLAAFLNPARSLPYRSSNGFRSRDKATICRADRILDGIWKVLGSVDNFQVYGLISVPSTFKNLAIHSGWAGQAGAVTRLPSTWALEKVSLLGTQVPPATAMSGLQAG